MFMKFQVYFCLARKLTLKLIFSARQDLLFGLILYCMSVTLTNTDQHRFVSESFPFVEIFRM